MGPTRRFNPFYALLVVAGILFALTACAYGVMMFASLRWTGHNAMHEDRAMQSTLVKFMEARGGTLLTIELAVLAAATVGAIATDNFWQNRGRMVAQRERNAKSGEAEAP